MFGGVPEGVRLSAADYDRMERCKASPDQRRRAWVAFHADSRVQAVVVPIAFPGKQRGVWVQGQVVEHPEGAVSVLDAEYGSRAACDEMDEVARAHLGDRPGVAGHVLIYADGKEAVFEAF
jgi:hypothetical protein